MTETLKARSMVGAEKCFHETKQPRRGDRRGCEGVNLPPPEDWIKLILTLAERQVK